MALSPHPHGRVFTAAVGLGDSPVPDDWSAFNRPRIYFAMQSKQISRGDHLFALGAARKGAVLGLFEVTSAGAEAVPSPEDPAGEFACSMDLASLSFGWIRPISGRAQAAPSHC